MGVRFLEIAEKAKVKVFVIDAGLLEADRRRYGGPRQHFKSWIGQMLPDNEQAGCVLGNVLIRKARQSCTLPPGRSVKLLALGGNESDAAAGERMKGLTKALAERSDAVLLQAVPANWSYEEALTKTPMMLKRYPAASAIWAANANMGLGAIKALDRLPRRPGNPVVVGSIDWSPEELKAIDDGKLAVSVGGHIYMGGWAMVLLYDYHYGLDFAKERTTWHTEMLPITRENFARYKTQSQGNWNKIDFRAFSKKFNPGLRHYDFTIKALLAQLADAED
jgi:ABC-type sugar transport system substrate-binding protein